MPTIANNIQFQEYQYQVQVPQGAWRWTTRVDVSKATVVFSVKDIISPYGIYLDRIPIPGLVITAMAESITDLQSAFAPAIVLSPTSLVFTLTQGQGAGTPQYVSVSNGGVYGSLLSATVTSDSAFVTVSPANVSSLAFNSMGQFAVIVDTTSLLAVNSPYTATLTVQDPNAANSPQTIPITIVVVPLAIISLSEFDLEFFASAYADGTFPPVPAQTFNVQNTGGSGSSLDFQIQKLQGNSPWLVSFAPTYGTLASWASQTISVVVQPVPGLQPGTYTDTLRVSGFSSNSYQDIPVTLVIECG